MKILAIESSCDETAAAVVEDGRTVHSSIIASQVEEHRLYGGVVPEIASRRHAEAIVPVVTQALEQASLTLDGIDAIAVTYAPGLIGALLVGKSITDVYYPPGIFYPQHPACRKDRLRIRLMLMGIFLCYHYIEDILQALSPIHIFLLVELSFQ